MSVAVLENKSPKVRVKRRGNALGFWFFETLIRMSGLKAAYLLLEGVCLHYLLFDREAVAGAMAYIEKRFPEAGAVKRLWHVHRLFVSQGRQLIDRHIVARKPDFLEFREISRHGALELLQDSAEGVVLLLSHAGNWQVALRQMGHLKKEICVVMRAEDNAAVRESLKMGFEGKPVSFIDPESHLGGVVEMIAALNAGKLLCIMGDRAYSFETLAAPFLGQTAYFPYGAFLVAAAARCPVVPFLTHKTSERAYSVELPCVWRPVYEKGKDRRELLRQWVSEYAEMLEDFVKKYPYECFLFHNVWHQDKGVLNERQ